MTGAALDAHVVVARGRGFRLDASLALTPGETVAVMGPSGAGKSSLLAAIAGHVRPREGFVRIDGAEVAGRHPVPVHRRGVVLLGQDPRLFPHLSARDNVAFGLRARGTDKEHARAEADEWLWKVGLDGFGDHRPPVLSGGQQQRAALARALATSPRILLLDEPLTALDPETAGDVRAVVADQLQHGRTTTILVTHDAVDAASLASRLIVLEQGRITQQGAVRDVLAAPATRFAAAVAGVNRVLGTLDGGLWRAPSDAGGLILAVPDAVRPTVPDGSSVAALIRPGDVRMEPVADATWTGAVRLAGEVAATPGSWIARVVRVEQTPAGGRVHTAAPGIAVDVPADLLAGLALTPGTVVRLTIDAAAVRFAASAG